MTRIAVNTRLLKEGRLEGIGWFAWQSLQRIVEAHPEVEFHFFFDAPPSPMFLIHQNVTPHVLLPPARRIVLYKLWFDYIVPARLRSVRPDLFLSPDGFASLRTDVKQLPVIHDLNFEHHPEMLPTGVAHFYRSRFPRFAKVATRIATVSEYSANDIHRTYGIDRSLIDVVYNGVNPEFVHLDAALQKQVRKDLTGGAPYFVFVGSLHPRKNVDGLIRAFARFKKSNTSGYKLVIAGAEMWRNVTFEDAVREAGCAADIVFTGRLQPERLAEVVGAARAMCFVPHFEGFGIPALEAFAAGVPLVASNTTSLPEVCGDAALSVDPADVAQIADAMARLSADDALCEALRQKGSDRVAQFSWDRTAKLLWASIEHALGNGEG